MLPRKLTIFCTLALLVACVIEPSAAQNALGRFQGLPLNCYSCTGNACLGASPGRINKCTGNTNQSCATVFNANDSVIERGCSDTVSVSCADDTNNCYYCQSSGCNVGTSQTRYVECLDCDTATNVDCLYNISKITSKRMCLDSCMTALYPRNPEDSNPTYELARTCLDDKDLDDQESCEAEEEPYCAPCTAANCNIVKLPAEDRRRCLVCEGEDCEDPQELECSAYRANDQCFTLFDSQNDIARMGCRSSLEESVIALNKRKLYLCDNDLCNLNVPTTSSCVACNSANDSSCLNSPNSLASCNSLPNTQCVSYLDDEDNLVRDCLSNVLSEDLFDACLSSNDDRCSSCTGNSCNRGPFPADRVSCLQCDGRIDVNCDAGTLEYAAYCDTYLPTDVCVTTVENGVTRRSCGSEYRCDPSEANSCRVCSGNNCNTVDLARSFVGDPGRWQDLPLSCYNCNGTDCISGLGISTTCSDNNLQNCMSIYDANNTISRRGCSDAVNVEFTDYCEQNPDKCFTCKSNNCNNAQAITEYIDCYFCDSSEQSNCAVNYIGGRTRKCKSSCMVALYPSSLQSKPVYETSRSCLDDLEVEQQQNCTAGSNSYCTACTGNKCNVQELPEDRLQCYKCTDETCQTTVSSKCATYQTNDQCFVLFNDENAIINAGCRSEVLADTVLTLTKQKQFWVCDGSNCNDIKNLPQATSCLVCNSDTDGRCISEPNALTTFQTCSQVPYTECMSRVTETGSTERGCLSSLSDDTFYNCLKDLDGLCQVCTGATCNALEVYPAGRRQCHQCNAALDANCDTAPNSLDYCPLYAADDTCVTSIQNGFTVRGCNSSIECTDPTDTASCRVCNTDGCNTVNLLKSHAQGSPGRWQELPLSCYTCDNATGCATFGTPVQCTKNLHQSCYTVFGANGAVMQRGCGDDVLATQQDYCDQNTDKCLACNSNSCNSATTLNQYVDCLFCDTERNGQCVSTVTGLTVTRKCYGQCMVALYPRSDEQNPAYGLTRTCLNDLEEADRTVCAAGNNTNCVACTGAKCNSASLPITRRSCLQCEDENCDEPVEAFCSQYRENDRCFTQFDETGSIWRLGCRSDFTETEADFLLQEKRVLYCDGDNCNTLENIPASQTCLLCSSRQDDNCAALPGNVTAATSCAVLPYTQCYTRVLSDGSTERGCLSSLEEEQFSRCLLGNEPTCKVCNGSRCNNELYPIPRLSCQICDSATNPNCETAPDALSVCPVYDTEQNCVSLLRGGITYRGCSAKLTCEEADDGRACQTCSTDGCNTVNVARLADNNYGRWQDLPLTCLDCTGAACRTTTAAAEKSCTGNNNQDCLTVFDDSNAVVRRGCQDDVFVEYGDWCSKNPDKCYNCKSNRCNSATSLNDFVSCLYCDSNRNLECLFQSSSISSRRQCQGGCMTALYPAILSSNPSYDLIRTCLNDKETAEQQTCRNGKDDYCSSCTTPDCNVNNLPAERLMCYQCSGENCDEPEVAKCPIYKPNDQCFTLFDETNSVAQLGCASSLNALTLEELIATKRILVCNGTNCNALENIPSPQQCVVCDSNENPLCATNAFEISNLRTCTALPYTSCFSQLTTDGATKRGCATDLDDDSFVNCVLGRDGKCEVCSGDGCNRDIFPANRLQCFTCDSTTDTSCVGNPISMEICSTLTDSSACVTALTANVTVRGCNTDLLCDANDKSTCRSCSLTGCNSIKLQDKQDDGYHGIWQDLPLSCYNCVGEQCLYSLGVSAKCMVNDQQDCMTVFNSNGEVRRRGCSDDVEDYEDLYCREHPNLCFKCKSNECNVAWNYTEYVDCVFCDSATNPECATHPANAFFPLRKCYKECLVAVQGQAVIRSCLDDKEIFDRSACRDTNNAQCSSCDYNECNEYMFPRRELSCHVCANQDCTSSVSQKCTFTDDSLNYCFAKYENNGPELLGCANTRTEDELFDWALKKKLFHCETDNCNALATLPTINTCVSCNSTADCAQNPAAVSTTATCNPLVPQCYSLITEQGLTVRGCLADLTHNNEYECVKEGTCETCDGRLCNNQLYPENRRSCYICNSVTNTNCDNLLLPGLSQVCPIYEANDVCVTRLVNNNIERGCLSQIDCNTNNATTCNVCDTDNCNVIQLGGGGGGGSGGDNPTGSASLSTSSLLTLLLTYVVALALRH